MHKKSTGQGRLRSMLSTDGTPLREFYLKTDDALIYAVVNNYFNAVEETVWKNQADTFVRKTIGVQAFFDVLRKLIPLGIDQGDLSKAFFLKLLAPCRDILFSDYFFHASGAGRQRIRTSLELRLGIIDLKDINEEERSTYNRLCDIDWP